MKKIICCLYALYFVLSGPMPLAAEYDVFHCNYSLPSKEPGDENLFQKLLLQSLNEAETFASVESSLINLFPYYFSFQFKYPLADKTHAKKFAKILHIKAQEAHRFVPVIALSQFISPRHLGFIRNIEIANNGPTVLEHVLVAPNYQHVIFIEEYATDSNGIIHPGGFAALNSIVEENGHWYFVGLYLYRETPDVSEYSEIREMFDKTFRNMLIFSATGNVDLVFSKLKVY